MGTIYLVLALISLAFGLVAFQYLRLSRSHIRLTEAVFDMHKMLRVDDYFFARVIKQHLQDKAKSAHLSAEEQEIFHHCHNLISKFESTFKKITVDDKNSSH